MLLLNKLSKHLDTALNCCPGYYFSVDNSRLRTFLSKDQAYSRLKYFNRDQPLDYDIILKINKGESYEGKIDVNFNLDKL